MATLNQRIAMSLLRQCAFVWEHCCVVGNFGSYSLKQIVNSVSDGLCRKSDVTGGMWVDLDKCKCWEIFGNPKCNPIEGVQSFKKESWINGIVTLQIDSFRCSYNLRNIFSITYDFCKVNCPSLMKKTVFRFENNWLSGLVPVTDIPVLNDSTPKPVKPKRTLSLRRVRLRVLAADDDFDID